MTKLDATFYGSVMSLLLTSCQVGPDYVPPEIDAPDAWQQELTDGLFQGEADLSQWWTLLNDPVLDDLIERTVAGNYDLRIAMSRIEEARARFRIATGQPTFK